MDYHGVEGHSDLLRDPNNDAIVNVDILGYEKYIAKYQNIDRVLILDYKASWLNICDQKFINYKLLLDK